MSNSTRPSSSYDERFVVPLEASRRGAHRARVGPVMAALPVVLVVGIVVGAIGLVYVLFGSLGGTDSSQTAAGPTSTAPTSTPSASVSGAGSDTPPSSPVGTANGTVDRALPVSVYNGTSPVVSGLARKAANKISAGGWKLGEVQTWTGTPVGATTVYYSTDEQRATAAAVAKTLGRGSPKLNAANAGQGIAVVVGNDYPSTAGGAATTPRSTSPRSTRASTSTRTSNASSTSATDTPTQPAETTSSGAASGAATTTSSAG